MSEEEVARLTDNIFAAHAPQIATLHDNWPQWASPIMSDAYDRAMAATVARQAQEEEDRRHARIAEIRVRRQHLLPQDPVPSAVEPAVTHPPATTEAGVPSSKTQASDPAPKTRKRRASATQAGDAAPKKKAKKEAKKDAKKEAKKEAKKDEPKGDAAKGDAAKGDAAKGGGATEKSAAQLRLDNAGKLLATVSGTDLQVRHDRESRCRLLTLSHCSASGVSRWGDRLVRSTATPIAVVSACGTRRSARSMANGTGRGGVVSTAMVVSRYRSLCRRD